MPKLDLSEITPRTGSIYPAPHDRAMEGRTSLRLGDAGGLTQFGANLIILEPGAKSSLRHWHVNEDEFVMVTQGVCTLIDNDGPTQMHVGDCAAFPANTPNGHHFVNSTDEEVRFLVIGTRGQSETAHYPDNDMKVVINGDNAVFTHADGSPLGDPK